MTRKKLFSVIMAMTVTLTMTAQTPMWNDPGKNADNRMQNVADFFAYENAELAKQGKKQNSKRFLSLEGNWKFKWVKNANERPEGFYAAALIEECGLKGYSIGGAEVSKKHSGFIVNDRNATAEDVKQLVEYIKKVVLEKKGVELCCEIKFVE